LLGDGDRFARQRRLVHLQLRNLDEAQVGWNLVSSLQQHDVARHQGAGGQVLHFSAAQHGGMRSRQLLQRRHGLVCAPGLHETDDGIEHHDHQNDQCVCQFSHQA